MKIIRLMIFALTIDLVSIINGNSQSPTCFTDQLWAQRVKNDSSLFYQKQASDRLIAKQSNNTATWQKVSSRSASNPTVIPTVIYIINDGTPASNISMQQIQSQVDQLNATYAAYGYAFCLAKYNVLNDSAFVPQTGDSAGVFRIKDTLTNLNIYTEDAALKALSNLPSQNYCRIFVVNSMTPVGVLGFAHFPGSVPPALDGIVVLAQVFGSRNYCPACNLLTDYDLGATLIHEAGHYLNLYHTFQGGCYETTVSTLDPCQLYGDQVCDTPPTDGSFGCPNPAPLSCDAVSNELITDFMDYTTDHCKNEFTPGQNARMDYSVLAYRPVLTSTQNLINTGITCVSLTGQYANFTSTNFNGCLGDTMTFTSSNGNGFTYHWNFGDGDTAVGATGYHIYTATGQFLVTLTAVNTSQGISESSSTPVFITACSPIACGYDKWEFEFGELDFSSGQPVATNHPVMAGYDGASYWPSFYGGLARGDSLGNPLFYFNSSYSCDLFNASRVYVDSMGYTEGWRVCMPSPGHADRFCLLRVAFNSPNAYYNIIDAANSTITFPYGRTGTLIPPAVSHPIESISAIPNCDGTEFWVLIYTLFGSFAEYKLNNDVLTYQATYTFPNVYGGNIIVSPDGKIVSLNSCQYSGVFSSVLFNFNKITGVLTQKLIIPDTLTTVPNNPQSDWSVVFSPNSRFLYKQEPCCFNNGQALYSVYQYDMYNPNPIASRVTILQFPESYPGPLYLDFRNGPDKKTYFGYEASTPANSLRNYRLGVINYPNVLADNNNSIGLNTNGPVIKPANCPYPGINNIGFTGFNDRCDAFDCSYRPGVPPPFTYYATGCSSYQFRSDDCFAHRWSFGDTLSGTKDTSTQNYPVHNFSDTGTFIITLNANGYIFKDTITITAPVLQLANSGLTTCPVIHGNYSIAAIQPGVTYNWFVTNGTPAYASAVNNIDVQWNGAYTNGVVKAVAISNTTGCADSATLPVSWAGLKAGQTTVSVNAGFCSGTSYSFYGKTLDTAGTYTDTIVTANGCDSLVTLNLAPYPVAPDSVFTDVNHICPTDTLKVCTLPFSPGNYGTKAGDTTYCAVGRLSGNYSVTYTDAYGCTVQSNNLSLLIHVGPPQQVLMAGDTTLPFSQLYQVTLNGAPVGADTIAVLLAQRNGNYSTQVTDSNGCITVNQKAITGVINNLPDEGIFIYPNPSSGSWQLAVDNSLIGAKLEVYDEQGRVVFKDEVRSAKYEITAGSLPSGVYYLRISNDKVSVVRKLVKI